MSYSPHDLRSCSTGTRPLIDCVAISLHVSNVQMEEAMKEVNVTELRQNLPGYLAKVRRGDRIRVTSRLTLRAKLVTADQRLRASPRAVTVW